VHRRFDHLGGAQRGNPQKAQRYAREWAEALRVMARLGAEVLVPGHGYRYSARFVVRAVLNDTANYLQSLYDQTIPLMNAGAASTEVIHTVKPPASLAEKPGCRPFTTSPSYSCATSGGSKADGTTGTPSNLKPATDTERAAGNRGGWSAVSRR